MNVGIMQGRLVQPEPGRFQSFPRSQWESEFARAAQVPLDYIEWIWDLYGLGVNPIDTEAGIATLKKFASATGIQIRSICADYFMDLPFLRCKPTERNERLQDLQRLMAKASMLSVSRIIVPFVDNSAIRTDEDFRTVLDVIMAALPTAEKTAVELHLETSLGPADFKGLLDQVVHPMLKVNYDSGNSASLGYSVREEFDAYGDRVGSVHIKDRLLGGTTVPLGTGNADFRTLFDRLDELNYSDDFTLQVARGAPGDEVAWAKRNLAFLREYWKA